MNTAVDKPLVSIVLPTYKRAHVLPLAIRSVLNQTYTNFELIVVDDNSPDDTPLVVQSFRDPRIRYVRNEPNLKLPRALNKGFALSQGSYLTWTSDDNLFAEDAIEKMVEALEAGGGDFVYADYYLFSDVDANGHPLNPRHDKLPNRLQLEKGNHIGACFMYTRRLYEAVGDYDPELFLVEDYDYFMRASNRFNFCHLPEPLYYFRRDDATLYYSRFLEVKASDFLARYKNGLMNEKQVANAMVALLIRNLSGLRNPILRGAYAVSSKLSFRLASMNRQIISRYLQVRLGSKVSSILNGYRSANTSFGNARDALKGLMQALGEIERRD